MTQRVSTWLHATILGLLFLPAAGVWAQSMPSPKERIDHDIKYLASDELEGREPGTPGIEKAAQYIIDEFKQYGVSSGVPDGSYRQPFEIQEPPRLDPERTTLNFVLNGAEEQKVSLELGKGFQALQVGGEGKIDDVEVVFVGYGIDAEDENYQEYNDVDVDGKVVVLLRMEPQQKDEESVFKGTRNSKYAYVSAKLKSAVSNGAAGIIMVNDSHTVEDNQEDTLPDPGMFGGRSRRAVPFMFAKREAIEQLLEQSPLVLPNGDKLTKLSDVEAAIDDKLEPLSQPIVGWKVRSNIAMTDAAVSTDNIIGVIEGEGPNADETIVIGAHYDHLGYGRYGSNAPGRREIHNGCDDNATGTAGVIELARRFAQSEKKPARRLVFIAFSGEERGLLGSEYYANSPTYPLENTVAMINYDMIGMLRNDKLTLFGTGTADVFDKLIEDVNKELEEPLSLDKRPSPFAGSDHLAFSNRKIPVLFLHTGLTDFYHTPEDDYELMNIDGAVRVIDYTENLINHLANVPAKDLEFQDATQTRKRPAYLGVRFDYEGDHDGLMVLRVAGDSSAEEAGLQKDDLVIALNGEKLTTANEVRDFLTENRPGDTVTVTFVRDGEEKEVEIELTRGRRRRSKDKE